MGLVMRAKYAGIARGRFFHLRCKKTLHFYRIDEGMRWTGVVDNDHFMKGRLRRCDPSQKETSD